MVFSDIQTLQNSIFANTSGHRPNATGVVVFMLYQPLPQRAAAVLAIAGLRALGNIRVISIGMSADIRLPDLQLLTAISSDAISTVSYQYLITKVQTLSTTLCTSGSTYGECIVNITSGILSLKLTDYP